MNPSTNRKKTVNMAGVAGRTGEGLDDGTGRVNRSRVNEQHPDDEALPEVNPTCTFSDSSRSKKRSADEFNKISVGGEVLGNHAKRTQPCSPDVHLKQESHQPDEARIPSSAQQQVPSGSMLDAAILRLLSSAHRPPQHHDQSPFVQQSTPITASNAASMSSLRDLPAQPGSQHSNYITALLIRAMYSMGSPTEQLSTIPASQQQSSSPFETNVLLSFLLRQQQQQQYQRNQENLLENIGQILGGGAGCGSSLSSGGPALHPASSTSAFASLLPSHHLQPQETVNYFGRVGDGATGLQSNSNILSLIQASLQQQQQIASPLAAQSESAETRLSSTSSSSRHGGSTTSSIDDHGSGPTMEQQQGPPSLRSCQFSREGRSAGRTEQLPVEVTTFLTAGRLGSDGFPIDLPTMLALPEDQHQLSPHQFFLRQHIEAFRASESDTSTHKRGRNKQIVLNQVGIRCRHCSSLPVDKRQTGSTYFPATLSGLYQAAQNMSTMHLQCGLCSEMPEEIRQRFTFLISTKVTCSGAGRPYWEKAAKKIGLVDSPDGIRFIRDEQSPTALPSGTSPLLSSS